MKDGISNMNTLPRRNRLDLMHPAEIAILNAMHAVESLGADVKLTDAVISLQAAKEFVSDYIDNQKEFERVNRSSN